MSGYVVKPLSTETWPDFARLVERHNGVWGGCWCMGFHAEGVKGSDHRAQKQRRVELGEAQPSPGRRLRRAARCAGRDRPARGRHRGELAGGRRRAKVSNAFLFNATAAMFEQEGFTRTRQLGKNNWLMTKRIRPSD